VCNKTALLVADTLYLHGEVGGRVREEYPYCAHWLIHFII